MLTIQHAGPAQQWQAVQAAAADAVHRDSTAEAAAQPRPLLMSLLLTCVRAAASSSSFAACLAARLTSDSMSAADTPSPAAAAAAPPCRPACCCSAAAAAALGLCTRPDCRRSLLLAASASAWLLLVAGGGAAAKMLSRMSAERQQIGTHKSSVATGCSCADVQLKALIRNGCTEAQSRRYALDRQAVQGTSATALQAPATLLTRATPASRCVPHKHISCKHIRTAAQPALEAQTQTHSFILFSRCAACPPGSEAT